MYFPSHEKYFNSIQYLKELGAEHCRRLVGSEKDLETYERLTVEQPITSIISKFGGQTAGWNKISIQACRE
jgi:hypothetical protein